MTTRVRKEENKIIESHFSREQAKLAIWRHRISSKYIVQDRIVEKDGRFEIVLEV